MEKRRIKPATGGNNEDNMGKKKSRRGERFKEYERKNSSRVMYRSFLHVESVHFSTFSLSPGTCLPGYGLEEKPNTGGVILGRRTA